MNYMKLYFSIVRKALRENRSKGQDYYESHHIRPKSIGGSNKNSNLVLLTGREHFICHALLAKAFVKNHRNKVAMIRAFHIMRNKNPHQKDRYFNSRLYEFNKRRMYGPEREVPLPNEGKKHKKETKAKMREAAIGRVFSDEHKANLSKNSAMKNSKPWNYGKKTSEEQLTKMSLAQKGKPKEKKACEICQKAVSLQNYTRHIQTHNEGVSYVESSKEQRSPRSRRL